MFLPHALVRQHAPGPGRVELSVFGDRLRACWRCPHRRGEGCPSTPAIGEHAAWQARSCLLRRWPELPAGAGDLLLAELHGRGIAGVGVDIAREMNRRGPAWSLDQVYNLTHDLTADLLSAGHAVADIELLLREACRRAGGEATIVPIQHRPLSQIPKPPPVPVAGPPVDQYDRPTRKDLAVAMVLFSPAGFRAPLMHYARVRDLFREGGIPLFTIALAYGDQPPPIPDADFLVRSESILFHKENLANLLEQRLPERFTKVAFIDADVVFSDRRWYDRVSRRLDRLDIIQPHHGCRWTDRTGAECGAKPCAAKAVATGQAFTHHYHPGFAWAFRRETFRAIGGFYDKSLVGGGDMVFVSAVENQPSDLVRDNAGNIPRDGMAEYDRYRQQLAAVQPRVGYLTGCDVWHLYHGERDKRGYSTRSRWMPRGPLTTNADGVIECADPHERKAMLTYFRSRDEDEGLNADDRVQAAVARAEGIPGWSEPETLEWLARHAVGRELVIELGTHRGRSLAALALAKRAIGTDRWNWDPTAERDLRQEFAAELAAGSVELLKLNLYEQASVLLDRFRSQADLVYIDANHAREPVLKDIALGLELLRPGGVLCGHDLGKVDWPGVKEAVTETFGANYETIPGSADGLWWTRPKDT